MDAGMNRDEIRQASVDAWDRDRDFCRCCLIEQNDDAMALDNQGLSSGICLSCVEHGHDAVDQPTRVMRIMFIRPELN